MTRPTFVALSRTLLFSSALLLCGCPGGKSSEPPSRPQRPAAPARAAAPALPADPAPVDAVPAALPEPGPEPARAPEILGFSAASTELPAGGTTTLELQLADAQAAAGLWWSATCGAAARDPEAPWRAIFVAPARAGSCTVTVQVENRERTDRREASLTLTVFGGDPDAPAAEPAARPAPPEPQPFYFDESAAAAPELAAAPEPAAQPLPDVRPPEPPAPPAAPPIAAPAAAGPERWVTVMEDDFRRPSGAAVGGRWREYMLRRPGPAARSKAGNGDWVIRKDVLSIWVRNEIGAVEDFVATDDQLAIDGTRVEFELRAELPSSPEASVLAFWDAGPEALGSMAQLPGRAGIACSHDGRGGLRLLPLGSPAAARPTAPGAWTRHTLTVRGNRMSWQVGDEPAVEIPLAAPFDPGARGRFVFAVRAHVKQWHKVDVRGFRLSRLER